MNLLIEGLEKVGYKISDSFYEDVGLIECEFKIAKNPNRFYLKIIDAVKPKK